MIPVTTRHGIQIYIGTQNMFACIYIIITIRSNHSRLPVYISSLSLCRLYTKKKNNTYMSLVGKMEFFLSLDVYNYCPIRYIFLYQKSLSELKKTKSIYIYIYIFLHKLKQRQNEKQRGVNLIAKRLKERKRENINIKETQNYQNQFK